VEVTFHRVPGLVDATLRYLGGTPANPAGPRERWDSGAKFSSPIVREIIPTSTFCRAAEYHQWYLEKRGLASYHVP
jgi:peptide methionine sulfoxide reductase MsrA